MKKIHYFSKLFTSLLGRAPCGGVGDVPLGFPPLDQGPPLRGVGAGDELPLRRGFGCRRHRPGDVRMRLSWQISQFFAKFCKFLAGSFSAVSKRNVARKYAFDSIFQAKEDLRTFAPLQS